MDQSDFYQALKDMGHDDITEPQLKTMFEVVNQSNDGPITWMDFLKLMKHDKRLAMKHKSPSIQM